MEINLTGYYYVEITKDHLDMMILTNEEKVAILKEVHNINNPIKK